MRIWLCLLHSNVKLTFPIDVCDVTLSVYPHRTSLKNMPGHGGKRTYDLSVEYQPNALPTELRGQVGPSMWYFGIESSAFDINCNLVIWFFLCWCYVLRWIWCLWCYSECISTPDKLEKYAWPRWPVTWQTSYIHLST